MDRSVSFNEAIFQLRGNQMQYEKDGYRLTVYETFYMDYGLTIEKDGRELFSNPHVFSCESYGYSCLGECDYECECDCDCEYDCEFDCEFECDYDC